MYTLNLELIIPPSLLNQIDSNTKHLQFIVSEYLSEEHGIEHNVTIPLAKFNISNNIFTYSYNHEVNVEQIEIKQLSLSDIDNHTLFTFNKTGYQSIVLSGLYCQINSSLTTIPTTLIITKSKESVVNLIIEANITSNNYVELLLKYPNLCRTVTLPAIIKPLTTTDLLIMLMLIIMMFVFIYLLFLDV